MNELKIITHRPHQVNLLHDDVSNCKDSGYDDETAKDVHCNANFQSAHLEMDVQDRYKTSIVMMILVHHIGDDEHMAVGGRLVPTRSNFEDVRGERKTSWNRAS